MLKVTTPLLVLLAPFACCFNGPVHDTFCLMVTAWVACLGRRTISRVWQTTGRAEKEDHSKAYRLFNQAAWNWDCLAQVFLLELLRDLIPGSRLGLVIDDTLCHKRGAKVAFGGIFLDAVLSSKKHKCFRYGVNWVTLGVILELPFRKDRPFCVNLLWRAYSKKVKGLPHQTKTQLAREMLDLVASWLPEGKTAYAVMDSFYIGRQMLHGLPEQVHVIGPVHPKASLSQPLGPAADRRRKIGEALPNPTELLNDPTCVADELLLPLPKGGHKRLEVKVVKGVCWYPAAGDRKLQLVLVRDPEGVWRDELLLSTDMGLSAAEVVLTYLKRWSVEVAYEDSKQMLGLHDPMVWTDLAVQRAHPMAWFVGGLVLVWYARYGQHEEQAHWQRPWYNKKPGITFADMLATLRLHLWQTTYDEATKDERKDLLEWLLHYVATATD
jgi:DDE superfamily endonuclease